jgi:excisionase family DNA binding protein
MLDNLETMEELCDRLKVEKSWVYKQVQQNEMPKIKVGKYLRFDRKKVDAWVMENFNAE